MLWAIFFVLLVLWCLGYFGGVGGGLIHLLLAAAVIILIFQFVAGRRPLD